MFSETNAPSGIFLGRVGVGKTTIFNKICDEHRSTLSDNYSSATRTYASHKIFYGGKEMVIFDGPGVKSKKDTFNHSYVMRHGLTCAPFNGIFVFVQYDNRIGSIMADEFWEVAKQLKPEYMHMVVLVVTKMDQFQADDSLKSRDVAQRQISEIFASDHDVHEVVFSDRLISNENLFNQMYDALKDKPQVQLQYSEAEFLQYFELKAWKGRELHDLHRTKNVVQGITTSFIAGLNDLEEHRSDYTSDEWQDFIFSAIQQCHKELNEGVLDPFVKRNMNAELEFDDYAAYIELRKIVNDAQADVRNEAKRLLPINPDDTSNWRNALRRCQYCGEVWVKVSGCDDETTCGLIPEQGDPYGNEFFLSCMWTKVNGIWKPKKVRETKNIATRTTREIDRHDIKVGCGRKIDWKSQAILPLSEVETLFSTQELEQILNNIGFDIDFVSKKKKKESDIVVFSEVGADGKVVDP